jgi:uncharacterized protein (TIGR01777 family)
MRILVSGSSGFIGSALCAWLPRRGHEVVRLVRRAPMGPEEISWDPASGSLHAEALEGLDAVVHLGGAGIADERWTEARKAVIQDSRVRSTHLLAAALATLERKPRVLVSASAVGWYGDRGADWLDESSDPGTGFLAAVGRSWEGAAQPALDAGIRVVHPRTGIVLAREGGALAKMLPVFRLGLGGPIGSGRQWWSWITLEDALAAVLHAIEHEDVRGPFNTVSPNPVTAGEFASTLGRVIARPAGLHAPAFALRTVMGRELADEALLASQRARPGVLERTGFTFREPLLEGALRRVFAPAVAVP